MGIISPHLTNIAKKIDPAMGLLQRTDPLAEGVTGWLQKKPGAPAPLAPPNQDTSANASLQQQQAMLRRRGILGNVYAGAGAAAPATASKSTLGT